MHKPLLATDFLDRARRHYGDQEAIVATTGERFTYSEFGDRADRFAALLQSRGIEKGDRVAVLDPNTHYHLEAAYGAMQAGAIHTPLNYRLIPENFEYIMGDAGVSAIYADSEYAPKIDAVKDAIPTETFLTDDSEGLSDDWEVIDPLLETTSPEYDRPAMTEDEVITINYTSGTTGEPKGVCRTHRGETLHAYLVSAHQEITDDDVYLWTLPMFHVNGWGHLFAITGMGATHVCTRGVDIEGVFEAISDENVSYLCAAPTVLKSLVDHHADHEPATTGTNDMRAATAGAAPPEAIIRALEEDFDWHLKHVYGATETGPLILTSDIRRFFDAEDPDRFAIKKRQGIGYLGTDVRVVEEDGTDVPQDDETLGEIVVRGNQVMEGYWEKPDATEQAFSERVEGYYHTGDLATVDDQGMIAIRDRKKDIIISGGENISSLELEDTLFEHPAITDVAVIPAPSDEWGETPKAYVIPASGDPDDPGITAEAIEAFCREHLAGYKVVHEVEFVTELPTTATGKIQKYELRQQEWEGTDRMIGEG
jgi:fatty-acyl-CoA synthase